MKSHESFIREAAHIASQQASERIVAGDACNWIPRRVLFKNDNGGLDELPRLAPLNACVYSGTAGVSLFFAKLWQFTGDELHRTVARQAMHHATRFATEENDTKYGKVGGEHKFGFYLGTAGVGWAARVVGHILSSREFVQESDRLIDWLSTQVDTARGYDIMNGTGGGILALLSMADASRPARELASLLGSDLVDQAVREDGVPGISWGKRPASGRHNLTGISHGNAGIILALARLDEHFPQQGYDDALREALAYEDHWFLPEEDNWAHFDGKPTRDGRFSGGTMWCHGAPGIGAARAALQAMRPDLDLRRDLGAAERSTRRFVAANLGENGWDAMICHGMIGNLESLWITQDALQAGRGHESAKRAAMQLILQHGQAAQGRWGWTAQWPSAVSRGMYPPLIVGTAGVGWFLMRLAEPSLPPVLIPPVGPVQQWAAHPRGEPQQSVEAHDVEAGDVMGVEA